jgi:hypothetical protein
MHLGSLPLLGSVVARTIATLRRRLKRASIEGFGRRFDVAIAWEPSYDPQVVTELLEDARLKSRASLSIDGRPKRKIARQIPQLAASPHDRTQGVEEISQTILPRGSILAHPTRVRAQGFQFRAHHVLYIVII